MRKTSIINMSNYCDEYNEYRYRFKNGEMDYEDYCYLSSYAVSRVNKKSLMEDVNYFLNFCKDERNNISKKCEDEVYMVLKSRDPFCGIEDLTFLGTTESFNTNIIEIFIDAERNMSINGGISVVVNADYSISIDGFIEYEIGYITKKNFDELESKLIKNVEGRLPVYRVNNNAFKLINYKKFCLNEENEYYRLYEYQKRNSTYTEVEKKDFEIIEDYVGKHEEIYLDYMHAYLLRLIEDDNLDDNEVVSEYPCEIKEKISSSTIDNVDLDDFPF